MTIAGEAERATREARYPRDARVLLVGKENRIAGVRASLGPTARVLLAARLSGELYLVLASRE